MFRLSSSIRSRSPAETLAIVPEFATRLGISRVTDITRLDRIGIPVFASIRPDAKVGSLCVNAGKGIDPDEARIGAYMEAIEFAIAEQTPPSTEMVRTSPRNVLGGKSEDAILAFGPILGRAVDLDLSMTLVFAEEITGGPGALVPAELVYHPFHGGEPNDFVFRSGSNGLASGNSVAEATAHALLELIERDISSFEVIHDTSLLVTATSMPAAAKSLLEAVRNARLQIAVRTVNSEFRLPYFSALLFDPGDLRPRFLSRGTGCHVDPTIAIVRAICEAAQSRLSFIHGARDDLAAFDAKFDGWPADRLTHHSINVTQAALRNDGAIEFERILEAQPEIEAVEALQAVTCGCLIRQGFHRIYRVVLTPPESPVHVVRILVPGLECFSESMPRVGHRLSKYAQTS